MAFHRRLHSFDGGKLMSTQFVIEDLHGQPSRDALLRINNANARETSLLSSDRFDQLIEWARVALFIPPADAFLLAFEQCDAYDGGNFLWFRHRFDRFLYIDRVVATEERRRYGLGRMLYSEVFKRARSHPRRLRGKSAATEFGVRQVPRGPWIRGGQEGNHRRWGQDGTLPLRRVSDRNLC
jgi:predicted GNAT superfamily acetyltransferase